MFELSVEIVCWYLVLALGVSIVYLCWHWVCHCWVWELGVSFDIGCGC